MRVTSLASGSSGNALLVEAGPGRRTRLLVDAGLPGNILIERLRQAGTHPGQLQGVLVTHEHGDHIIGLPVLMKCYAIPVITAPETFAALERSLAYETWSAEWVPANGDTPSISRQNEAEIMPGEQAPGNGAQRGAWLGQAQPLHFTHDRNGRQNVVAGLVPARSIHKFWGETISFMDTLAMPLQPGSRCQIDDIEVIYFPVSHDALAPCGYLLSAGGCRVCIAIDSGEVTPIMLEAMDHADLLVLESNHDRERLLRGPYPHHLKMRILSPTGHLSNDQAAEAVLRTWRTDSVRWLWL